MTSIETPAATHRLRALAAGAVLVGSAWLLATPAHAGLGEPLDPDGTTEPAEESTTTTSTTEADDPADGPATTVTDSPTTTVATSGDADEPASTTEDDDGTSVATLGAVGVAAFVLGLLVAGIPLAAALSRRKNTAGSRPGPPVGAPPAPAGPTPAPVPASSGGPAIGPAPSRDADQLRQQRVVLVEGLIALRDKLPSAALGDEAAQALAAAGINEIRPEGQPFDPAQHRAVHQVATEDPARHNTVATVERPGYRDGSGALIRQPEVVVAVHGGSS